MPTNDDKRLLIEWLEQQGDEQVLAQVEALKERNEQLHKPFFTPETHLRISHRSVAVHHADGEPMVVYSRLSV